MAKNGAMEAELSDLKSYGNKSKFSTSSVLCFSLFMHTLVLTSFVFLDFFGEGLLTRIFSVHTSASYQVLQVL